MRLVRALDGAKARPGESLGLVLHLAEAGGALASIPLSAEEDRAVAAVTHAARRHEKILRRQLLRFLLAENGFAGVALSRGPVGEVVADAPLHVSASSRGDYIAAAIGPWPIGIDVETPQDRAGLWPLLSPQERMKVGQGMDAGQIWCAKEAVWKAKRMDVARDPASFTVLPDSEGRFICEGAEGRVIADNAVFIAMALAKS